MPRIAGVPRGQPWIDQIFEAQAANGGVVRRSVADVEQFASLAMLKLAVKERDFHLIRTADQYVIFCHNGDLTVIC